MSLECPGLKPLAVLASMIAGEYCTQLAVDDAAFLNAPLCDEKTATSEVESVVSC